jgi:hypothetical protein
LRNSLFIILNVSIAIVPKLGTALSTWLDIYKGVPQGSILLKRMGKYLNRLGKLTIYHSFILSNFNYCPVIWQFCSEANTFNDCWYMCCIAVPKVIFIIF